MPTKDIHTQKIAKGSRTYFFDIKQSSNEGLYLKISCSQKTITGFEHYRLIVFDRDLLEFVHVLKKSAKELEKLKQQNSITQKLNPLK